MVKIDDFEDEFDEEDEEDEDPEPKRTKGRPKKEAPKVKKSPQRYSAFHQQEAQGIVDVESNEVLATSVYEALAYLISKVEKMENTLGNMLGTR